MTKIIIGVMGPGNYATGNDLENAYQLGKLIAQEGWVLLTGGRDVGVMDAASQGAKSANGLTVGILPNNNRQNLSKAVDIAIITDLGNARNNVNVLSSHVVIACGMGIGTASEVALALKNGKKVILLTENQISKQFFLHLSSKNLLIASNPQETIDKIKQILDDTSGFSYGLRTEL